MRNRGGSQKGDNQLIKDKVIERLNEQFPQQNYHLICLAVTGSQAYGMNTAESDIDVMGIFLPPIPYIFGVERVDQVLIDKGKYGFEGTLFSFSKWFNLMIEQNPNVMELLWHVDTNYVYRDTWYWDRLILNRGYYLSKKLKHSYAGYAWAQMQRLKKLNEKVNQNTKRLANFEKYGYDVKAASHVMRLLGTALDALIDHEIQVMRPDRQFLLAIREGKYTYEQLVEMADAKMKLIEEAYVKSDLRNRIDPVVQKSEHLSILQDWVQRANVYTRGCGNVA